MKSRGFHNTTLDVNNLVTLDTKIGPPKAASTGRQRLGTMKERRERRYRVRRRCTRREIGTKILTAFSCSRYQEQELTSADSRHFVNSVMTHAIVSTSRQP